MFSRLLVLALFFLFCNWQSSVGQDETPACAAAKQASKDLTIELTAGKTTVKVGEPIGWKATVTNRGKFEVVLVKPGDGSSAGVRTPIMTWHVVGEGKLRRAGFDGHINALRADEVFNLAPGVSVVFDKGLVRRPLGAAGVYKYSFTYRHQPDLEWRGVPLKGNDPVAMDQIRRSAPLTMDSNVVEIRVE